MEEEKDQNILTNDTLLDIIISMAVESWRFCCVYERLLGKVEFIEQKRALSQYRWFVKKIDESLSRINLNLVTIVNHKYESGMPVTPLNIDEFEPEDTLIVDQMLEPIIVGKQGLIRMGTVTLRKENK
jgi:hypothetical protein